MLYDKRWDRTETKPDVFSLESLIAWLETMPPSAEYDFHNCDGLCLVGQYMAYNDIQFRDGFSQQSKHFPCTVFRIGAGDPWTFGAALNRARKALESA